MTINLASVGLQTNYFRSADGVVDIELDCFEVHP